MAVNPPSPPARTIFLPDDSEERLSPADSERVAQMLLAKPPKFWTDAVYVHGPTNDSGWLSVLRLSTTSWIVSCCGKSDRVEHFIVNPQSSTTSVISVRTLGSLDTYPERLLVSAAAAEGAVKTFIETLERDPKAHWEPVSTAMKTRERGDR
jgi:hypothetical protein